MKYNVWKKDCPDELKQKMIKEGKKEINKGETQVKEGEQLVKNGTYLMKNAETRYELLYPDQAQTVPSGK